MSITRCPAACGTYSEHERPEDAGGEFLSKLRHSILLPAVGNMRRMERKFDANLAGPSERDTVQEKGEGRKNII